MNIQTTRRVCQICNWQTDTGSIDFYNKNEKSVIFPHTILLFVPGNPGCIEWYLDMLGSIIERLGVGHAARAVSYAGHGIGDDLIRVDDAEKVPECKCQKSQASKLKKKANIAFTVDGQVEHKIEWVDLVVSELNSITRKNKHDGPRFVFVTHSFGAHLVQRMLILRKDILKQTKHIIHITPFHRYYPDSWWQKNFLSMVANEPDIAINLLKFGCLIMSLLPPKLVDLYLEKVEGIHQEKDRKFTKELYSQASYAHNFLKLGTEEIREIPEVHDLHAMRIIGQQCPTSILYCPDDHWAPLFHMDDLSQAQKDKRLPMNIKVELNKYMVHGFIVNPKMIPAVADFIVNSVTSSSSKGILNAKSIIQSKL